MSGVARLPGLPVRLAPIFAALVPLPVAPPADLFRIDGRAPTRIVVAVSPHVDLDLVVDAPMARAAAGVLADLGRRGRGRLLACVTDAPAGDGAAGQEPDAFLLLCDATGSPPSVLALFADDPERYLALPWPRDEGGRAAGLRRDRLDALLDRPIGSRGQPDVAGVAPERGTAAPLEGPFAASPVVMDERTMKRRLYRGLPVVALAADRDLDREQMHVRVPADYDPRTPAGLLVWASPTPDGRIPAVLGPGLDRLGLIAIGVDDTGNDRDVPDKFQLMFDAVETACRRYHVDRRRVYIAGMSGGGKVSSILTICFPEVFGGAVAIVGAGTHGRLPEREFGEHATPYFSPPAPATMRAARTRPIAFMSGPPDFNYDEMQARFRLLEAEGHAARFFDAPEMGHVMPSAEQFAAAIEWVNGPYRRMRIKEEGEAQMLLAAYFEGRDDPEPGSAADRDVLAEVMRAGPWTPAAWRALEILSSAAAVGDNDGKEP